MLERNSILTTVFALVVLASGCAHIQHRDVREARVDRIRAETEVIRAQAEAIKAGATVATMEAQTQAYTDKTGADGRKGLQDALSAQVKANLDAAQFVAPVIEAEASLVRAQGERAALENGTTGADLFTNAVPGTEEFAFAQLYQKTGIVVRKVGHRQYTVSNRNGVVRLGGIENLLRAHGIQPPWP